MDTSLIVLIVVLGLLAIVGPPMWWYSHRRKPGEKREKKWGAIVLGFHLIILPGYIQPMVNGGWIGRSVNMVLVLSGVWSIAFGAKGSRIN